MEKLNYVPVEPNTCFSDVIEKKNVVILLRHFLHVIYTIFSTLFVVRIQSFMEFLLCC
jgi:hypothetical protein